MKKTGRKRESSARSATSALTISGVGIRSTVIIWTGQRNLAARGNLRDGRGPPPPLSPALSPRYRYFLPSFLSFFLFSPVVVSNKRIEEIDG